MNKGEIKNNDGLIFFALMVLAFFVWLFWSATDSIYHEESNFSYEENDMFSDTNKTHFNHMPITYSLGTNNKSDARECPDYQIERIDKAFQIIENETQGVVNFLKTDIDQGDILIYCSNAAGDSIYMTQGQGGYESYGNIIQKGTLTMFTHRNCGTWPDVEIHEILHIFGYDHIDDKGSIMNPVASRCDLGKIDKQILDDLIDIYG